MEEQKTGKLSTKNVESVDHTMVKTRKARAKKNEPVSVEAEEVAHDSMPAIVTKIDKVLQKNNLTEAVLKEMEDNFLPLTISGLDDKEGYEKVHNARIMCRNTRTLAKKVCELGRKPLIDEQKEWIKTEKSVTDRIEKVEDVLAERQKAIDDEKEKIKEEQAKKEQIILQKRAANLTAYGMQFIDDGYEMDDIRISVIQVKSLDDFTFGTLEAKVKAAYDVKQEARRQEEERLKKIEEDNKRLQEEARLHEAEILKREAELKAKEEQIKLQAESLLKAAEEKKRKEEEDKKNAEAVFLKTRKMALFNIGFAQTQQGMVFKTMIVDDKKLLEVAPEKWDQWIEGCAAHVKKVKEEFEQARIERENKIANDAATQALKKKADDEAAAKLEADRLAALKPDGEQLEKWAISMSYIPFPKFKTQSYLNYEVEVRQLLAKFINHVIKNQPT
jgi:hypothetical protein